MGVVETPHFAWPFERGGDGKVKTVEQNTEGHVRANANVLVRCNLGFRIDRPEYGWRFPMFDMVPLDPGQLEQALQLWGHPNGTPNVEEYADLANAAVRHFYTQINIRTGAPDG